MIFFFFWLNLFSWILWIDNFIYIIPLNPHLLLFIQDTMREGSKRTQPQIPRFINYYNFFGYLYACFCIHIRYKLHNKLVVKRWNLLLTKKSFMVFRSNHNLFILALNYLPAYFNMNIKKNVMFMVHWSLLEHDPLAISFGKTI